MGPPSAKVAGSGGLPRAERQHSAVIFFPPPSAVQPSSPSVQDTDEPLQRQPVPSPQSAVHSAFCPSSGKRATPL